MGESATAVDAAQAKSKSVKFGLGKIGWAIMAAYAAFVTFDVTMNYTGVDILTYGIGLIVVGYVWIRVMKAIIKFIIRLFNGSE